jgi:dienelactone hydrolase
MGSKRRWILVLAVLTLMALVVLVAYQPSRVGIQALLLVPSMFDAPVRPLEWVSGEPTRETVRYRSDRPDDLADLWLPDGATAEAPVGGVVLVFGVNSAGRDHPLVVRVSRAIARTGVAVFVPDSASLTAGRLEPAEIGGVAAAVAAIRALPEIDPDRVGIVGFSVGGSLALLAATDPAIADDLAFVNAFGAYGDATDFLASIASQSYESDGDIIAWQPAPLAREVFGRLLLEQLPPADRDLLAEPIDMLVTSGDRPRADPSVIELLTPAGRFAYELATAPDLAAARRSIGELPAELRGLLDTLSPARHLDGLRTDIYLMHEVDDFHVPVAESRRLAATLESHGRLARFTEFRLFSHVQPDQLDPLAAAPEIWKLAWHVHALLLETV